MHATSKVVQDPTTKDVTLLETHVEICSASDVDVATSVVDLAVIRIGATVVGLGKGAV